MTALPCARVRLRDLGELVAGVPALLGFHPAESLVAIALGGRARSRIGLVLRADLPPPERHRELVRQLLTPVRGHGADAVVLVVVSERSWSSSRELVERTRAALSAAGIPVVHAVWAQSTRGGARWGCYDEVLCGGVLPDQATSVLTTAMTVAGVVTFDSREDVVGLLDQDDEDALARRGKLLDRAIVDDCGTSAGRLAAVHAAVAKKEPPATDHELVRLGMALSDRLVRDNCVRCCLGVQAADAERLWLALVRALPAPECAEPAVLLAVSAFLRGDGTLAVIALDRAETAVSGHRLAGLLRSAIELGLSPDKVRLMMADAVVAAERELARASDTRYGR
ncbi:MAG: DUF4192 domain-containing protein [Kutzneria sp.]|nr:DUF4192 domain-containing protein [Kutzneria sp.]MBV9846678.1 DUF4192 domain-containing protein [Kutzneria sp.]